MAISSNFPNVRPSLLLDFANSQQLDPRITFSRSTTAPYYNGSTVALAEQNLLLRSQEFDNASWSKSNVTVTADATTAPDGTTTADSVITTATTTVHRVRQSVTGTGAFTFSLYVKPNGYTKFGIWDDVTSGAYASFDCSGSGSVLASGSGGSSATITALTNGWYRISYVATISGTIGFAAQILDPTYTTGSINGSWLPDGISGVYLWGAQLEQRSSVTAYNATTTSAITNYIPQLLTAPINQPRFDFNPTTGESLGLLIEQSSTNLLTYSQDFSNAVWTKSNATITTGANIAPDGTQTMQLLVEDTANSQHRIYSSTTVASGTATISIYAKQSSTGSKRYLNIYPSGAGTAGAVFDLTAGTVTSTIGAQYLSSSITAVGNNLFKASITFTVTSATLIISIYLSNVSSSNAPTYTGDGYSGIYIWGAQLEALAFPTSYIPTTSAQVTRASDKAVILNVSGIYNATQGTILTQGTQNSSFGQNYPLASFSDGSLTNKFYTELYGAVTYGIAGNSATLTGQSVGAIKTPFKMALAAQTNDAQLCTNGTLNQSSSSLTMPPNISELDIGCFINFGSQIRTYNGCISKIAYYPIRVTNTQLQALTGS